MRVEIEFIRQMEKEIEEIVHTHTPHVHRFNVETAELSK